MFTGLVEETGVVAAIELVDNTAKLTVQAPSTHAGMKPGDSLAVNGCCLTVIHVQGDRLTFEAMPETMARTNLGDLVKGSVVNLERPLQVDARLGGHFVQGHIDGVGRVVSITPEENALVFEIEMPAQTERYFVEKGSIAVDGISLTVAAVKEHSFTVWIIPHTREVTTLGVRNPGDRVNLECDILGKYIERLLGDRVAVQR